MNGDGSIPDIEEVPDEDTVSRHVFWPHMYKENVIDARQAFTFPKKCNRRRESVIWRRYVSSLNAIHSMGCEKETRDNLSRPPDSKRRYRGCIEGNVGDIRAIEIVSGHGFGVEHAPEEGIHHVHVEVHAVNGRSIGDITKTEMHDLRDEIFKVFAPLVPHTC